VEYRSLFAIHFGQKNIRCDGVRMEDETPRKRWWIFGHFPLSLASIREL
jgi:hypothetical protein